MKPTAESVMSEREMFDFYNATPWPASRALLATVNEVLRRIAERERKVEGFVYTDAVEEVYSEPGFRPVWFSTPFFLAPKPKVCYATLIIGEPYQVKPQMTDAQKIEAALAFADLHRGTHAADHQGPCVLSGACVARKVARILRGQEEA